LDSHQHHQCADCAWGLSGNQWNLDRQRDDRLGRIQLLYPVQHRREILRAGRSLANTDSYGQPDAYANCYGHTYSDIYAHANSNSNPDANGYRNCNGVIDASSITYTKNSADPEESTHAPAAPVARLSA
jgi:hypothetical protein